MGKFKIDLKKLLSNQVLSNTNTHGHNTPTHITKDACFISSFKDIDGLPDHDSRREVYPTDFAIASGAYQDKNNSTTYVPLRDLTTGNYLISFLGDNDHSLTFNQSIPCSIKPKIRLDVEEYLKAIQTDPNFSSIDTTAQTITLGEFPQSYVGDNDNRMLNYEFSIVNSPIKRTNKNYVSKIHAEYNTFNVKYAHMYIHTSDNNKKYTRLEMATPAQNNNTMHGANIYPGASYWFNVEPIEWQILNWDNLPTSINPKGNGRDNVIMLESTKAITGVMPFNSYADTIGTNATGKASLYQNSLVRAYLNGYNIYNELRKGNGYNPDRSNFNFDMTDKGFINEAFSEMEMEMQKVEQPKMSEMKNLDLKIKDHITNKKRVKILKTPLSIDDQIKYYIDNRRSLMLHGKSGIGKSRRVADIDPEYFLLTLRNGMMPEEILGKECPNPTGEGTKWYAPSWYNELCEKCKNEPDKNHILFIDELTNVNEYEQSLVYHIVLNHSLGVTSGKLPENCVVVAAGNSKDESNSAYNMSEPLFRRFHGHIYLPLDLDSLLEWGSEPRKNNPEETNLHPVVSRFLSTYPQYLYSNYDPDKEGDNYAIDPRAWEQVSDIIYDNDNYIVEELLQNKLGDDIADNLVAFAEEDFITIEDILEDNYNSEDIPRKLDEQYALALSLRTANEQEIHKVRKFIANNLSGETLAKFDFVWVGKNPDRAMIVAEIDVELEEENAQKKNNQVYTTENQTVQNHSENIFTPSPLSDYFDTNKEMTINEFMNHDEILTIYCSSKEQIELLAQALGKDPVKLISDLQDSSDQNKHSCFVNNGCAMSVPYAVEYGYPIYDFNQIDFSEKLPNRVIRKAAQREKFIVDLNSQFDTDITK